MSLLTLPNQETLALPPEVRLGIVENFDWMQFLTLRETHPAFKDLLNDTELARKKDEYIDKLIEEGASSAPHRKHPCCECLRLLDQESFEAGMHDLAKEREYTCLECQQEMTQLGPGSRLRIYGRCKEWDLDSIKSTRTICVDCENWFEPREKAYYEHRVPSGLWPFCSECEGKEKRMAKRLRDKSKKGDLAGLRDFEWTVLRKMGFSKEGGCPDVPGLALRSYMNPRRDTLVRDILEANFGRNWIGWEKFNTIYHDGSLRSMHEDDEWVRLF